MSTLRALKQHVLYVLSGSEAVEQCFSQGSKAACPLSGLWSSMSTLGALKQHVLYVLSGSEAVEQCFSQGSKAVCPLSGLWSSMSSLMSLKQWSSVSLRALKQYVLSQGSEAVCPLSGLWSSMSSMSSLRTPPIASGVRRTVSSVSYTRSLRPHTLVA
jgi:hypothetical protein